MVTPDDVTKILAALTALIIAVGGVIAQLRQTHALLNGRMTELLEATRTAAQKQGEMAGRDSVAAPVKYTPRK